MTQREKVLKMLKAAGSRGVRSDHFYAAHLPRAAARIKELRDEGHNIVSEHVHPFVVYRLAGLSAEGGSDPERTGIASPPTVENRAESSEISELGAASLPVSANTEQEASDVPTSPLPGVAPPAQLFEDPKPKRSMYDPYEAA